MEMKKGTMNRYCIQLVSDKSNLFIYQWCCINCQDCWAKQKREQQIYWTCLRTADKACSSNLRDVCKVNDPWPNDCLCQ